MLGQRIKKGRRIAFYWKQVCYTNDNFVGSDSTLSVSRLFPRRRHSGPINFVSPPLQSGALESNFPLSQSIFCWENLYSVLQFYL